MKNKLPRQVFDELEANPNISPEMMKAARHANIRDEGWDRIGGNGREEAEREITLFFFVDVDAVEGI